MTTILQGAKLPNDKKNHQPEIRPKHTQRDAQMQPEVAVSPLASRIGPTFQHRPNLSCWSRHDEICADVDLLFRSGLIVHFIVSHG